MDANVARGLLRRRPHSDSMLHSQHSSLLHARRIGSHCNLQSYELASLNWSCDKDEAPKAGATLRAHRIHTVSRMSDRIDTQWHMVYFTPCEHITRKRCIHVERRSAIARSASAYPLGPTLAGYSSRYPSVDAAGRVFQRSVATVAPP
jgi:hypothetical protein